MKSKILTWYRATFLDYPLWRVRYNDGTKTILLHYHEAKSLKDVFGGKLFIDYTINKEVTNE